MPLYKFGAGDVFHNRIETHPSSSFFMYNGHIFYRDSYEDPARRATSIAIDTPRGFINLYELNTDRPETSTGRYIGKTQIDGPGVKDTGVIYPFVYKGRNKDSFKNISYTDYTHKYQDGDVVSGSYKISASISREHYIAADNFTTTNHTGSALKNSLDFAKRLGSHYNFDTDKTMTVIGIPSVFYGSEIRKGTVSLKLYASASLAAELRDSRRDGALIQHSGTINASNDGSVAGVVLYKEGFIILTGSWDIALVDRFQETSKSGTSTEEANIKWYNWGQGVRQNDGTVPLRPAATPYNNTGSYLLNFQGTHRIPTITMMAHANKGQLNYTNNPTSVVFGTTAFNPVTSSYLYREQELAIANVHSASYNNPSGSLVRTTYITKVGIYDDKKKLIGIATVSKPVKKTEERDLTFKLKLDI